jgi:hypothetical protein
MLPCFAKAGLLVAVFVLLFLVGCNRVAKQQSLAVAGVQGLRDAFNKPGCQSIVYQIEGGNDEWRRQWLTACQTHAGKSRVMGELRAFHGQLVIGRAETYDDFCGRPGRLCERQPL